MSALYSQPPRKLVSWPLLIGCLGILFACLQGSSILRDADTLWHIRSGDWILAHRTVPLTDIFSHTFPGKPWTSHEWLASSLLYLTFQQFSWPGVVGVTAIAFGATLGLISRFMFQRLEPIRSVTIIALIFASLATHLLARPHVLVMPLLAAWVIQCVVAIEQRRTPTPWLLATMVFWVNLHGSFMVGILLTLVFAIEAVSAAEKSYRDAIFRKWAAFFIGTVLAALISPHHIHAFLFPFQVQGMTFAMSAIHEWRSPDFQKIELQEFWMIGLLFLGWLVKIKASWIRLLLLGFLLHQSLVHTRHLTLLAIIAPVILAIPFQRAIASFSAPRPNGLDLLFHRLSGSAHPAAVAISIVLVLFITLGYGSHNLKPPESVLPERALAFVRTSLPQGNVLNEYIFGGALIFNHIPVTIDGRADLYGDKFLRDYYDAIRGKPKQLIGMLESKNIAWTFLPTTSPAVQILDLMPDWKTIYADDLVTIHQKK